jgi:hypothetical protein
MSAIGGKLPVVTIRYLGALLAKALNRCAIFPGFEAPARLIAGADFIDNIVDARS